MDYKSLNTIKIIILFLIITIISSLYIYEFKGMPSQKLFADVAIYTKEPLYIGLFSQIGLFLWASSATICFYCSKVFEKIKKQNCLSRYLLDCGLISTILLIDDAFCIHEIVLPLKGIKEETILFLYLLIGFLLLIKHRNQILLIKKEILLFTVCLFLTSLFLDILKFDFFIEYVDIEEIFKFGGIISWVSYLYLISSHYLNKEILKIKKI